MYSKDYKQCINDKESQINALKLSQEAQRIQYTEEITRLRDSKQTILNNLLTIYRTYIYQIMIKVKDINSVVSSTSPDAELRKYINTLYEQITEIEAQIKDLYSNSLFINSS
jgi:CBS domain containing-hemolysin-like protein